MTKCQSFMRSEDGKRQIKYKGIHEPKGRVKGFRVEIRPPNSAQKIWVGTFDTRGKAKRAFDAAVYLIGKEPYYYVYPEKYFPPRPHQPSREAVQVQAKIIAEKTDDLEENPVSFLVDAKAGSAEATSVLTPAEQITLITPDVKVVDKMGSPVPQDRSNVFAQLDEYLQDAEYLQVPVPCGGHAVPALDANPYWSCYDLLVEEAKSDVKEAKVDVEEEKTGKEGESAAFYRGLNTQDFGVIGELLDQPPPETFDVYPSIDDEYFFPLFDLLSKPSSKGKCERAGTVKDDCTSVGSTEGATTAEVDWWDINSLYEPTNQLFDFSTEALSPIMLRTDEPVFWALENQ